MQKLLPCPHVYHNDKLEGYGGDQAWFEDKWAVKAGCASVSATDVKMYYMGTKEKYQKEEYLESMKKMYQLMKPKNRGFPYAYLYARRVRQVLQEQGVNVSFHITRNPESKEALELVKRSIDQDNPIGLLILRHRRRKVRDDLWHWVTIFGYQEVGKETNIIFLDCGEKKEIPARILFEKHRLNVIKMVAFDKH